MSKPYTIRNARPNRDNKYYISTRNGGYSQCIRPGDYSDGVSYFNGSVLSNCVGYACGRYNEIYSELTGFKGMKYPSLNCNAEGFINRAKETYGLEISPTPVLGGILVWQKGATLSGSDGAGHVGIVERVIDHNTIYTSESNYGAEVFLNKTRTNSNGKWGIGSKYRFLGCVVNPAVGAICLFPSERNELFTQIEVDAKLTKLRVRSKPSLSGPFVGWSPVGCLTYTDVVEADGYKWYRVADKMYVAGVDGVKELPSKGYHLPNPVAVNPGKKQVRVSINNLRVRESASTSATIMGMCKEGVFDILCEANAENMLWYNIGENSWIAKVSGVSVVKTVKDENLIDLDYDPNYDYRWSVDGNKYGDKYDVTVPAGHHDNLLEDDGWQEVLAVNGGLFYTWDNQHFANGIEKSRGINNQDPSMTAVTDYNHAMSIGCTYDGQLVFAEQSYIVNHLGDFYGAVTGMGVLLGGQPTNMGHKEFKSQWDCVSGRTIIGEDKDGNYMSYSFEGVTGKSGMTGPQIQAKCQELGFHNAIMMDGGGSVFRRYMGETLINTSRKIKNSIHLYRKKKANVPTPTPDPKPVEDSVITELKKQIEELNKKVEDLNSSNAQFQAELANKNNEIANLENQNSVLTNEITVAKKENQEAQLKIKTLEDKINSAIEILK